jgi:hypothetical protein
VENGNKIKMKIIKETALFSSANCFAVKIMKLFEFYILQPKKPCSIKLKKRIIQQHL